MLVMQRFRRHLDRYSSNLLRSLNRPLLLYLITIFHRCHRFASFRTISHFVLVHRHRIFVQSIMYPDEYRSTHLLLPSPSVQRSITWPVKVNNLHTPQRSPLPPRSFSILATNKRFAKSFQFSSNFPLPSFSSKFSWKNSLTPSLQNSHEVYY